MSPAPHPAFAAETEYIAKAWEYLDRGLAEAETGLEEHGAYNRATQQAMHRALQILKDARGQDGALIAGRMDLDGEPFYIGRRGVHDHNHDRVVVNWRAPVASRYFEATPQDPHGLDLKRVFVEEDRQLKKLFDEIVRSVVDTTVTTGPVLSDALLDELERSRDGAMREVVATIQAEQYRIIRAAPAGVLVVQGGPGTGKTVIGLHRAAWLAYNHPDIQQRGLLIAGPSAAFLTYVSGVLPSLDAGDLRQVDMASLYAGEAAVAGGEAIETARIKGSGPMAVVLRRALDGRVGWDAGDLSLALGADRFSVPQDEIRQLLDDVRSRPLSYSDARDVLRPALSSLAFRHYADNQRAAGRPQVANEQVIRRLSTFTNALDRMWPTFTPEELLRSLYGTQSWLVAATDGILPADERARLFRTQAPSIADEPWTSDDLFCLDELAHLIYGAPAVYGHIVVDEAQDLSPMQARALGRRCPSGSFTVLGDLAQATGAWIRDDWSELTLHLAPGTPTREELSVGYRVPASVLELAARQLPLISPGLTAPTSIREGRSEPAVVAGDPDDLLGAALDVGRAAVEQGLTTAVVVADDIFDDARGLVAARDLDVGDGRDGDFSRSLTLLPATDAKGLEFDAVVVTDPAGIVAGSAQGRRLLYVAMTRPTQLLYLVHSGNLPDGLDHLLPTEPEDIVEVAEVPLLVDDDTLEALIGRLDEDDRMLVEVVVRRLLDQPSFSGGPGSAKGRHHDDV